MRRADAGRSPVEVAEAGEEEEEEEEEGTRMECECDSDVLEEVGVPPRLPMLAARPPCADADADTEVCVEAGGFAWRRGACGRARRRVAAALCGRWRAREEVAP